MVGTIIEAGLKAEFVRCNRSLCRFSANERRTLPLSLKRPPNNPLDPRLGLLLVRFRFTLFALRFLFALVLLLFNRFALFALLLRFRFALLLFDRLTLFKLFKLFRLFRLFRLFIWFAFALLLNAALRITSTEPLCNITGSRTFILERRLPIA